VPNCFQLMRKDAPDKPVAFTKIDEELCELVGEPVHPKYWLCGWYDIIGFAIATGKALGSAELDERMKDYVDEPVLMQIYEHLKANYTSNAWVEIGRR
jgi:hypothetical protein